MTVFILVHGGNMTTDTWNRLIRGTPIQTLDGTMGGRIWDPVIPALEEHHHRVFAPTLHDEHTSSLTDHIRQICGIIARYDLRDIVLAGHSYGGMVITGAAAGMAERIRCMIYIDAAVPDPGQSLFDILVSGGYDPQSFAGLEPAPPYVEKLQFDAAALKRLKKTYILCTKSEFAIVTTIAKKKIAIQNHHWKYREIPASHVPMADMPAEIVQIMLDAGT